MPDRSGAGPSFLRPLGAPHPATALSAGASLPPDLAAQAVSRLRTMAFLYAAIFFLADLAPLPIVPGALAVFVSTPAHWLPSVLSIALGIGVGALTYARRLTPDAAGAIGILFLVASSYGIAFAQYHNVSAGMEYAGEFGGFGLSWVAPWVLLFTVAVPAPPRRALMGAIGAVSSVPIVFALELGWGYNTLTMSGGEFFFSLVFPYVFIVLMAWVGSRVIYRLGVAVKQARELGSYRLVDRLGKGGMGEVWSAEHRLLARPAAVKLIRPEMLGEASAERRREVLRRFEREAQATAAMRCPHTVELYDFGVSDDGAFYYVMELLDGLDAETLVEQNGPQPAERVVYLWRQVCHSLGEAHQLGLIHRDVKPANVSVCCYGRELDWVKVLDFGLVMTEPQRGPDVRLTADGAIGGTPAFMAPEQVLGDRPIDGRTDIYAAGCLAYWLLTGTLVFGGRTAVEMMMKHVEAEPVPPTRRSALTIPAALERAVLACLEKDPDRRPATADALDALLAEVPLESRWTAARALAWWRANCPPHLRERPAVRRALEGGGTPDMAEC
jgi:serine/threonine-protein kinase